MGANSKSGVGIVNKSRYIWDIRAWQLLREQSAARFASSVVPQIVDGVHIHFPQTEVSLGLCCRARCEKIEGQVLLETIYDPVTSELAMEMAIIALKALAAAKVSSDPFVLFGRAYRCIRRRKILLSEKLNSPLLTPRQNEQLAYLTSNYVRMAPTDKRVLVHGDLHASNLIADFDRKSLGFVDLEMVHIGKPATNFAQLWIGFHMADPLLGQKFYQRYTSKFPEIWTERFDSDVRAEVAMRSYFMIRSGERTGNQVMAEKARNLLGILNCNSFEQLFEG